jgi:hypothetical protein
LVDIRFVELVSFAVGFAFDSVNFGELLDLDYFQVEFEDL